MNLHCSLIVFIIWFNNLYLHSTFVYLWLRYLCFCYPAFGNYSISNQSGSTSQYTWLTHSYVCCFLCVEVKSFAGLPFQSSSFRYLSNTFATSKMTDPKPSLARDGTMQVTAKVMCIIRGICMCFHTLKNDKQMWKGKISTPDAICTVCNLVACSTQPAQSHAVFIVV